MELLLERFKSIASEFEKYSDELDNSNRFPSTNLEKLKEARLMAPMIPKEYGGDGAKLELLVKAAQIISSSCLSTGMIWAMHCQQLCIIINHANEDIKKQILPKIADSQSYIVSVTSEYKTSDSRYLNEMTIDNNVINISRAAPNVTGANYGDIFIILMNDYLGKGPVFALAERNSLKINTQSNWNTMGMKGTESCSVSIKSSIKFDDILGAGMTNKIQSYTAVPIGHIMWVSSWLGACKGVLERFLKLIRSNELKGHYNLKSDLFLESVGKVRMKIDMIQGYLDSVLYEYITNDKKVFDELKYKIKVNNLKISASEYLFQAVDELLQIAGLNLGYQRNKLIPLERVFRDLRSARLMLNNHKLLSINGKLSFLDR
ncbi:acyl-CoA dehydrogenase family protein [Bacillus alkalicellulosilyticus]|uniref:acyl-CoA dehydrogenase family protein n=1 Tax=Alkalihalobacterium alkalicellulosilyticum TaxID=1912214 RepID=UPI0009988C89|nr:acyl-CoA dehydrogenase family protein [Bacillus alkalicellulosilyticus]